MKKLFKVFSFVIIMNLILSFGFLGWFGYSLIFPSFEGTGITLTDLFKKNLTPEKYEKLNNNVASRSKELSEKSSQILIKGLEKLFPSRDFDYSKVPAAEYPYPSIDEVLKMNEENAQKGIEQGLKYLEESEKKNQVIKNNTLSDNN